MDSGVLVVQLIIGVICCLFGLKFQKAVVALIGVVAGFFIGSYIVNMFGITGGLDLVLEFGLALVFGACSFSLFETLVSLIVGFCIFSVVGDMFSGMWYGFIIGIIFGVIGGLIVSKFYKFGIILFTSFIGTHLIADSIYAYFTIPYSYIIIFGILFVGSVLIQMSTNHVKI